MIFIWFLIDPILDLLGGLVSPIIKYTLVISIIYFIDLRFNLGISAWVTSWIAQVTQDLVGQALQDMI
jgi:hypothetical protein